MFDDWKPEDAEGAPFSDRSSPNPFQPVSYADRLRSQPVHAGRSRAPLPPLRPGQPYGYGASAEESWLSPPSSLPPFNVPEAAPFPEALPPYSPYPPPMGEAFPAPATEEASFAPPVDPPVALPPYLQKRPALRASGSPRSSQACSPPPADRGSAAPSPFSPPAVSEPQPAPQAEGTAASGEGGASGPPSSGAPRRRRRALRHAQELAAPPDASLDDAASRPAESAFPSPPLGIGEAAASEPAGGDAVSSNAFPSEAAGRSEPFPGFAGGSSFPAPRPSPPFAAGSRDFSWPAPPREDDEPFQETTLDSGRFQSESGEARPYRGEPFVTDEIAAFFGSVPDGDAPPRQADAFYADGSQPYSLPQPSVCRQRSPFDGSSDRPAPAGAPPPSSSAARQTAQGRPPVRPWRVASLAAAAAMLLFCAIVGGRIVVNLAQNEREMKEVRSAYLEREGVGLQSGASRVDLPPPGETFTPTATPAMAVTSTPTPVIPINENAIQSLNQRDTSAIEEAAPVTPTPPARTRAASYADNPLRNVVESMRALHEEYPDVVARLEISGVLDEVVAQRNNTYYLTHNYRGGASEAGAVFVDESCSIQKPPENLLLRGQSAVEGKVFAPLWQYQTGGQSFASSAATLSLTTLYEERRYVLFAVIVADSDPKKSGYFNYASHPTFDTDEAMLSYVQSAQEHSLYRFNVDVAASDRLLTLATLGSADGRCLVLLFRMIRPGEAL